LKIRTGSPSSRLTGEPPNSFTNSTARSPALISGASYWKPLLGVTTCRRRRSRRRRRRRRRRRKERLVRLQISEVPFPLQPPPPPPSLLLLLLLLLLLYYTTPHLQPLISRRWFIRINHRQYFGVQEIMQRVNGDIGAFQHQVDFQTFWGIGGGRRGEEGEKEEEVVVVMGMMMIEGGEMITQKYIPIIPSPFFPPPPPPPTPSPPPTTTTTTTYLGR